VISTILETLPPPGVTVVTKVLPLALVVVTSFGVVGVGLMGEAEVKVEPSESVVVTMLAGALVTILEPAEFVVVTEMTVTEGVGVGVGADGDGVFETGAEADAEAEGDALLEGEGADADGEAEALLGAGEEADDGEAAEVGVDEGRGVELALGVGEALFPVTVELSVFWRFVSS